jgi:membrane protein CcdC involved in cytochrome C biogenesis
MQAHPIGPAWPQYVVPVAVAVLVLLLRMRRMSRARPLRLERLWIVPALYLLIVAASFAAVPPTVLGWVWAAAGLVIGAGLGWQRGKTMRIEVDPATHQLNQRASPAGFVFLALLILIRQGARLEGGAMHLDVAALTNALLALALGMFTAMRVEMYLRAKRLLANAPPR